MNFFNNPVHPHACGEHIGLNESTLSVIGSSPRLWGTSKPRMQVYQSMLKGAKGGVVPAQKEFLDRTEGKVIDRLQVGIDEATLSTILTTLPPEQAEKTKAALLAITTHKTKP